MAGYDLDDLIRALQRTVGKGQRAVRRQQQEVLQRIIDLGENGEPKYLTWVCRLPSGDGGERSFEMMRIPWASLPSTEMMEISELSVEFPCKIRETRPEGRSDESTITVVPIRGSQKQKDKAHSIRIALRGPEGGQGEVTVDGVVLKEIENDRFLLAQEELSRLLRKDTRKIKPWFRWKSLLFWLLMGLLLATIAALIIHLGAVALH
jgi:hypothetical protein